MKVVALVSGGKDSCYVMLKCLSYEHIIVALAHIAPRANVQEMDSFMYQSIGSAAIPTLAETLRLPLYTRETSAAARVTTLSYAPIAADDEVEDLRALLRDVKAAHPEVEAVCAGALWSDYQRLRVESAASRTGLLSLAYLWRRDQRELLDEMVAAGVHAVLVKVAAVGLNESHLGKSLAEMRATLLRLEEQYGVHVCGEGGEYETLVLSLPTFDRDIVLSNNTPIVCQSEDPVSAVSYLAVPRLELKPKTAARASMTGKLPLIPPLASALQVVEGDVFPGPAGETARAEKRESLRAEHVLVSAHHVDGYSHVVVRCGMPNAAGVAAAARALRIALKDLGTSTTCTDDAEDPLGDVLYIWLRLDALSGAAYASANAAYSSVFGTAACTPPPVRACVGMTGTGAPVTLEALARTGRRKDQATVTLHVQSVSEWAPPCIGPYAQTVADEAVVHICGVLPLAAPTVSIPDGLGARAQVRACMHNMARTLEAAPTGMERLRLVVVYATAACVGEVVEDEVRAAVPRYAGPVAVVPVDALPKGALVEIRAVAQRDDSDVEVDFGEEDDEYDGGNDEGAASAAVDGERSAAGRLGYVVFSATTAADVGRRAAEADGRLLSLHVYCVGPALASQMEAELAESAPRCAALVASVGWLVCDAPLLCIATLVRAR
jgi:diphthine-ammonia ligase